MGKKTVRTSFIVLLAFCVGLFSLFYFDLPWNLVKPVFHQDDVNHYANLYGVDPLMVTAIIKVESNFLRRARSHAGAVGLMQLLPSTARELALELGYKQFTPKDLEDARLNIQLGAYYLYKLQKEFYQNPVLALAAYNAGMRNVQTWHRQNPLVGLEISDIPYKETKNYINEVMTTYKWLKWIRDLKHLVQGRNDQPPAETPSTRQP